MKKLKVFLFTFWFVLIFVGGLVSQMPVAFIYKNFIAEAPLPEYVSIQDISGKLFSGEGKLMINERIVDFSWDTSLLRLILPTKSIDTTFSFQENYGELEVKFNEQYIQFLSENILLKVNDLSQISNQMIPFDADLKISELNLKLNPKNLLWISEQDKENIGLITAKNISLFESNNTTATFSTKIQDDQLQTQIFAQENNWKLDANFIFNKNLNFALKGVVSADKANNLPPWSNLVGTKKGNKVNFEFSSSL